MNCDLINVELSFSATFRRDPFLRFLDRVFFSGFTAKSSTYTNYNVNSSVGGYLTTFAHSSCGMLFHGAMFSARMNTLHS